MSDEGQGTKSELQDREKFQRREIGMEKKGLSVMLIVALLATSFLQIHAGMDLFNAFTAEVDSGKGGPCCDQCVCALSNPPKCQCLDVKSYCYPSCKSCRCTRSIPPQCRCMDIKDHCDKPCKATDSVN